MEVVTRKRRISLVDLRARVPAIARGLALFLLIAGTIFVGVSYYKMRNNVPFRLRSEAPALSKEITGIINGYEQRVTKDNRLYLWLRAARDVTYADGHHELEQVNLQVFPATGDKQDQITADRSLYHQKRGLLQFNGNVQIETHEALWRAYAAMGTWHPPPNRARKARSARTARALCRWFRGATTS